LRGEDPERDQGRLAGQRYSERLQQDDREEQRQTMAREEVRQAE
jgi:hypothetical protein